MITFHEKFDLTSFLFKQSFYTNVLEYMGNFLDRLVERSQEEEEIERDEQGFRRVENQETFKQLQPWLNHFINMVVHPLVVKVDSLRQEEHGSGKGARFRADLEQKIEKGASSLFVEKVGSKILDFVLDFEGCIDKIQELGRFAQLVGMTDDVCKQLKKSIESRLLSPGVTTRSIIQTYFNSVLALKILDPDMLSFREVTSDIKVFMKNRSNLVRSIISFWKDEK